MRLSELQYDQKAVIVKVYGHGGIRKRIIEMGFTKGKVVERLRTAPLNDPIEFSLMGYNISLRKSEAQNIKILTVDQANEQTEIFNEDNYGKSIEEVTRLKALGQSKDIKVALVGNPNCGKTSLFNAVLGRNEKVGNYSGVTVGSKEGKIDYKGYSITLVDLPGTYSISAYSPEEKYVLKHLQEDDPDLVLNVLDANNLERNLYLTTQLIDMNIPMLISLNMYDELLSKGDKLEHEILGELLGTTIVPTISTKKIGLETLLDKIIELYEGEVCVHTNKHIHINYPPHVEEAIKDLKKEVVRYDVLTSKFSPRFLAVKLLEKDQEIEAIVKKMSSDGEIIEKRDRQILKLRTYYKESPENLILDARYGFIRGALKETYSPTERIKENNVTSKIDNIVTNKFLGYPIFLLAVYLIFQATFTLGQYPMDWIEQLFGKLADLVGANMADGILKDLLVDGIIGGVGGVLVFLPNILILYFFIALFETTGYMARAAFIMDKLMHKIGLHGRSFIPLMMGFGCNVPAIVATRTIENRNNRLLTILINPLISCGARLPVYLLLVSAFFPNNSGLVLFSIYLTGILLAGLMSLLFKKIFFSKEDTPFVMELPPYRVPTLRALLMDSWDKCKQYIQKVATTILLASILIWGLSYFPRHQDKNLQQENSYLGQTGKFIQPVLEPLGFDWKTSIALLTGVAAKEVVVSSMSVLYNADSPEDTASLTERLKNEVDKDGNPVFDWRVALSLMLFVLIYIPCIGTISVIKNETESWGWALFTLFYTIALAWMVSFAVYQSLVLNIWQQVLVVLIMLLAIYFTFIKVRKTINNKGKCASCSETSCKSRDHK